MFNIDLKQLTIFTALMALLTPAAVGDTRNRDSDAGFKFFRAKQYDQAVNSFTKVIQAEPKSTTGYYWRAECNVKLSQFKKVINDCTIVTSLKPTDANAYRLRGFAHMQLNQFELGIADYTHVLQLNPGDKEARTNRALACRLIGKPEPAVVPIKSNYDPKELVTLGRQDHARGNYKQAIKLFTDALVYNDQRADTYYRRAESLFAEDRYQDSSDDLKKAIQLNPNDFAYHYSLGKAYSMLNQYDKAIESFKQVTKLDPNNAGVHMRLGGCYFSSGQREKAIEEYTLHLKRDPGDARVKFKRAELYRLTKNYPKALADYNQLVALNPDDEDAHRFRGTVYLDSHDYKKAVEDFTTTINLDKENASSIYLLRAKAYQALGKPELAAKDLRSAKEFDLRDSLH